MGEDITYVTCSLIGHRFAQTQEEGGGGGGGMIYITTLDINR